MCLLRNNNQMFIYKEGRQGMLMRRVYLIYAFLAAQVSQRGFRDISTPESVHVVTTLRTSDGYNEKPP